MREGKSFISGREGMAGSWFFRDRAGFRTGIFLTRLRVKKHRMFIRCEIVQEQLLTSKLDGAEFLRKIKKIAKILGGRMGIMVDISLLGTAGWCGISGDRVRLMRKKGCWL